MTAEEMAYRLMDEFPKGHAKKELKVNGKKVQGFEVQAGHIEIKLEKEEAKKD